MKGEITSKKKTIQSQKKKCDTKDKRTLLTFCCTDFKKVFVR